MATKRTAILNVEIEGKDLIDILTAAIRAAAQAARAQALADAAQVCRAWPTNRDLRGWHPDDVADELAQRIAVLAAQPEGGEAC